MDRNKAFTNVLALVSGEDELREAARQAAAQLGFDLIGLEDPEPYSTRRKHYTVHVEIERLAQSVAVTGKTQFDALFTWVSDG